MFVMVFIMPVFVMLFIMIVVVVAVFIMMLIHLRHQEIILMPRGQKAQLWR